MYMYVTVRVVNSLSVVPLPHGPATPALCSDCRTLGPALLAYLGQAVRFVNDLSLIKSCMHILLRGALCTYDVRSPDV